LWHVRTYANGLEQLGMLRDPQHERKIINEFKASPFVLSYVEGLL
jgi:hypothetical protein